MVLNRQLFSRLALLLIFIISSFQAIAKDVLYVGTGVSPYIKRIYLPLYQEFEEKTGIKIVRVTLADVKLLDDEEAWFAPDGHPIDIINAQATRRLLEFYNQGKIKPLNKFWDEQQFDEPFGHHKLSVTFDGKVLGIPTMAFGWQIFYLKSRLGKDYKAPETIAELIATCERMVKQGVIPFHLSSESVYVEMAWFEYIILRTYGLEYFNELMAGKHPYSSNKVKNVLTTWQRLINGGCFNDTLGDMAWPDQIPFFLRNKIGMMFIGNSLITRIKSPNHRADLGFFPFPKIADIPRYESAPAEVYSVNSKATNMVAVNKFLTFMSGAKIQQYTSHLLGRIPGNRLSEPPVNKYVNDLSQIVLQAEGTSAFIDRLLHPGFEVDSRPYFVQFVKTGDVKRFMIQLEGLRKKYYLQKNKS